MRRRPRHTVPSARQPLIEVLGDDTYILRLVSRVEYMERLPCDGQLLEMPARRRSVAPPLATSAADSGMILAPRSAQCRGAAPANPEADHRRGGSPSTLLVLTNVICMCHLLKFRSEAMAPRAPCRAASARCRRRDGRRSIFWEMTDIQYVWYDE